MVMWNSISMDLCRSKTLSLNLRHFVKLAPVLLSVEVAEITTYEALGSFLRYPGKSLSAISTTTKRKSRECQSQKPQPTTDTKKERQIKTEYNTCNINIPKYEPTHDKTNKIDMRPAKTQINLDIRPVWSVFAVRMKKAWVLSYPLSAQRRLWSDWADAQVDQGLRWVHSHFVGFVQRRLISQC